MDNGKQILDVSYGKFSCRLEGFEDSVETMKLVVGYFHELAGHEDFMDMELQAPDMAALQELTEEHAEGDVAITEEDGQIRLTVEESAEAVDGALEDLTAEDFEEVEDLEAVADNVADEEPFDDLMDDDAAFASDLDEVAEDVDEMAPTSEETDAVDPLDDDASVADKLNHIRSVVSGALPADTETEASDAEDMAEDLSEEEVEVLSEVDAEVAVDGDAEDDLPDTFSDRLAALAASDDEDDAAAEDVTTAEDAPAEESQTETAMASDDDDAAFEEELAALEEEDALAAAETAETDEPASDVDSDDDLMAALDAEEEALADELQEDLAEESAAQPEDAETAEPVLDATMAEDIVEDLAAEAEMEVTATDADDLTSDIAAALDEPDADDMAERETASSLELEDDLDDVAEEATAAEAAEEPEAETAETTEEAEPVQEEAAAAEDPNKPFLLTPNLAAPADEKKGDDEFNLASEVAKVEAEIAARPGNEVARHGLPRSVEDAMSRILSQTDQQLNAPESKRHRDAFAQLKAAVAATEAARQLGEKSKIVDPEGAFKDDLGAHDAEGKSLGIEPDDNAGDNVTPLKLVATQAIENAEAANQEPVDAASEKLRRIAALKERDLTGVKKVSFADFAAQQGATDLIDMLEAAAAYITFVEGDPDFTRPQVMKVVQSASEKEITREEGLRSFGRLLRQARFIKLNNGRFQVAENTQYRPDDDWAAQG